MKLSEALAESKAIPECGVTLHRSRSNFIRLAPAQSMPERVSLVALRP
jgi:hypothetical protein